MVGISVHSAARKGGRATLALVIAASLVISMMPASAYGGWWLYSTELVSATPSGAPGDEDSNNAAITDDGQVIAFDSWADDLSPDDTNVGSEGNRDIFVRDMANATVDVVTITPEDSVEPTRGASDPSISDDGRYIAFTTGRSLVSTDTNGGQDIYVSDRETGDFMRPTLDAEGDEVDSNYVAISGGGGFVAFDASQDLMGLESNGARDVYLWEMETDLLTHVSEAPLGASRPNDWVSFIGVSDDGQKVAMFTYRDLVPEDDNNRADIYVRDMSTGDYTWADVNSGAGFVTDSASDYSMSGDGENVVFTTRLSLVAEDGQPNNVDGSRDVYVWMGASNETTLVTLAPDGAAEPDRGARDPSISDDGSRVAFFSGEDYVENDTNGAQDVYFKDLTSGEFERVILTSGEGDSPGDSVYDLALSGDGMWLAFNWWYLGGGRRMSVAADAAVDRIGPAAEISAYDQIYVTHLAAAFAPGALRLGGADRYATAIAISQDAFDSADTVIIATGQNWPDALCASTLAGAVVSPVLLTRTNALPANVAAEIGRLGARNAYIVGGTAAVSAAVEEQLYDILDGYVYRLGGADRYGTSRAIAGRVIELEGAEYSGDACVATGGNFPDALAGSPLGAGLGWPILLSNPKTGSVYVPADTTDVAILGGTDAVSAAIEASLKADLGNAAVTRVGGLNRYETAAMVAQYGVDHGLHWDGVGIACGTNFPDALTGGSALGLQRSVLLLTPNTTLDPYAKAALEDNKAVIDSVHFFGGTAALSDGVVAAVKTALGL